MSHIISTFTFELDAGGVGTTRANITSPFPIPFNGYGVITSPDQGTFNILITLNEKTLFMEEGVSPNSHIEFSTELEKNNEVIVDLEWLQSRSGSATVELYAN